MENRHFLLKLFVSLWPRKFTDRLHGDLLAQNAVLIREISNDLLSNGLLHYTAKVLLANL